MTTQSIQERTSEHMANEASQRRHDIDWLRAFGMVSVFIYHCARFFDLGGWHVKNPQSSLGISVFVGVI